MKKITFIFALLWFVGFSFSQEIPLSWVETNSVVSPFFLVNDGVEINKYEIKTCKKYDKAWKQQLWIPVNLVDWIVKKSEMLYVSWSILYSSTKYDDYQCTFSAYFVEKVPVLTKKDVTEFSILDQKTVVVDDMMYSFSNECLQESPWSKVKNIIFSEKDWMIDTWSKVDITYTFGERKSCNIKSITDYIEPIIQEMTEEIVEASEDPRITLFKSTWEKYIKEQWTKNSSEIAKSFISFYLKRQGTLWDNESIGKEIYKIFSDFISSI